jgi:hypothetical protein
MRIGESSPDRESALGGAPAVAPEPVARLQRLQLLIELSPQFIRRRLERRRSERLGKTIDGEWAPPRGWPLYTGD